MIKAFLKTNNSALSQEAKHPLPNKSSKETGFHTTNNSIVKAKAIQAQDIKGNPINILRLDTNNSGKHDIILIDANNDGKWDKIGYDRDEDNIIEKWSNY